MDPAGQKPNIPTLTLAKILEDTRQSQGEIVSVHFNKKKGWLIQNQTPFRSTYNVVNFL